MKNLLLSIIALVAISFVAPLALATDCDGGNGSGGFGSIGSTGGAGCVTSNDNSTTNAPVANGGTALSGAAAGANSTAITGPAISGSSSKVDDSGNSAVGNGFGNFSPDATSIQGQGQQQGQIGVNKSDIDVDTKVNTSDVNVNGQSQSGVNKQGQVQAQNSDDDFVIEGDTYEAAKIPVNSAAPVFAGACSQGVSAQMPTFGASAGTGNPVCDYVAVAGAFVAAGERAEALRVLGKAEDSADWRAIFAKIRGVLTLGLL